MTELNELLGRTLVVVAHPDDDAVACGALLQRMREPHVVFCTDGAPRDEYFWRGYATREAYAHVRLQEAARAMQAAGVRDWGSVALVERDAFVDQELFRQLTGAMAWLRDFAMRAQPEAILTLAYEGGHPDHDACSFLARQLADEFAVPVWEAPLYHRAKLAKMTVQSFIRTDGTAVRIEITAEELVRKRAMFEAYESQRETLANFDPQVEVVRPMVAYDYSRPPHDGMLNYEAWGWSISGASVCEAFQQYRANAARRSVA